VSNASVGAAILHYRRGEATAPVVSALIRELGAPAELLLVDNASGDGSERALADLAPDAELITCDRNGGYAAGMHAAVRRLADRGAEVVVLCTHDCVLAPGALSRLVGALENDRRLGLVGPVLFDAAAPTQVWSSGGWVDRRTWTPLNHVYMPDEAVVRREWLDGACLVGRVELLDRPEMWDDRYFMYLEDVQLGLAVGAAGWEVGVVSAATATQSSDGMPVYYAARNRLFLARKWGGRTAVSRRLVTDVLSLGADLVEPRRRHLFPVRLRGIRHGLAGSGGVPPSDIDPKCTEVHRRPAARSRCENCGP